MLSLCASIKYMDNEVQMKIRISKRGVPSFKKANTVMFIGGRNADSPLSVQRDITDPMPRRQNTGTGASWD